MYHVLLIPYSGFYPADREEKYVCIPGTSFCTMYSVYLGLTEAKQNIHSYLFYTAYAYILPCIPYILFWLRRSGRSVHTSFTQLTHTLFFYSYLAFLKSYSDWGEAKDPFTPLLHSSRISYLILTLTLPLARKQRRTKSRILPNFPCNTAATRRRKKLANPKCMYHMY